MCARNRTHVVNRRPPICIEGSSGVAPNHTIFRSRTDMQIPPLRCGMTTERGSAGRAIHAKIAINSCGGTASNCA